MVDMDYGQGGEPEVLRVREAAWRAYFAGDEHALRAMLPEDFIGISMDEGPFTGLKKTLSGARAFREKGGRLISLTFPETRAQQYGDVVILYGRYEAVVQTDGTPQPLRGRLTEIFLRRNGQWVHPGWHLDLTTPAAGPRLD